MNRNTILYVALVLVLVAGPVLWIVFDDTRGARSAPTAPPRPSAVPDVRTRSGVSGPRGARAIEPGATSTPPIDAAPAPLPPVGTPVPPHMILRVTLAGLDDAVPQADAFVQLERGSESRRRSNGPPAIEWNAGPAARFDLDATPLVPDDATQASFVLTVDREGYLPCVESETVWTGRRRPTEPWIADVSVTLRVAGFVVGTVQDERFARVGGADVGAFVRGTRGWVSVDSTVTDAQGEFRLRLVPGEANLVLVAGDGFEPACSQSTGVARAETRISPITLRPGLAVSGTLRFPDGRPVPGSRVLATPIWGKAEFSLGGHSLAYAAERAFDCPAATGADDGLFKISGLLPGDYDLAVSAPGMAADLLASQKRRVSTPTEAVALVLDGGEIVVQATCDGRPAARVRVSLTNEIGAVTVSTDAKGRARALVLPGAPYDLELGPPVYERETRKLVGPNTDAELVVPVVLRRKLVRPRLVLVLAPEDARGEGAIAAADVRLWFDEGRPPAGPDVADTAAFENGAAEMATVWSGAWRIEVAPRAGGFRLPATAQFVLRDGQTSRVDLKFPVGGRLEVVAHDPDVASVAGRFRVLTKDDEEVTRGGAWSSDRPLLPAGVYRIEFTPEHGAAVTVSATVVAGASTRVDVSAAGSRKGE